MPVIKIPFDRIERNPYRDLIAHPLNLEQVAVLAASIEETSFWEGLQVRRHPAKSGSYQLAFGHARLQAARECGLTEAHFVVVDLDDDQMIKRMALENLTQYGRDEYASYRESVYPAIERIMADAIAVNEPNKVLSVLCNGIVVGHIRNGGMPGEDVVGRYFGGALSLRAIRVALDEYGASGRLAAWHAAHNPKKPNHAQQPSLDPEALNRFRATAHVKAFADTVRELGVPVKEQQRLADKIVEKLKEPTPKKGKSQTAEAKRHREQWARSEQPLNERVTSRNIRAETKMEVAKQRRSPKERQKIEADARAISIEGCLVEMDIGLTRASNAACELADICKAMGGMQVDYTPSSSLRLASCRDNLRTLEAALKRAAKVGYRFGLLGV